VGLLNIANCCYLNSLLQCYFLMDKFKQILLTADPLPDIDLLLHDNKTKLKRVRGEYELLAKLKRFFTMMALTSKKYLDPTDVLQNLVDSVGEKLTYGEEKDLSEINIMVIERLSEGLTFSKRFFTREEPLPPEGSFIDEGDNRGKKYNSIFNPETGIIKQLFYGSKVEYYSQSELEKEEPIVSDFTGIILNPRFGTLENALDEEFNFSVEIKGETFGKQMFIREEPQYLFLYINRTEFDREEQQMHKNDQKFTFDFVLYLDRYMEKYRKERGEKDERIRKLINARNTVKEQLGSLQILGKKMEECYEYARGLEGWTEKLPSEEEFETEGRRLTQRLDVVERELEEVESRKEEYHLMYIFVHRGDAVSGHYWGYGRNANQWYRFDINCRLIPQEQILIDLEKSSGTPYALLFVKKENLPQFKYNYHLKPHIKQQ
jgi:ubiquitin carboxyl-terminal hydrolase 25/28